MPVWIQLTQPKYISVNGRMTLYHPGDWVQTGKQQAIQWIADGSAIPRDASLTRPHVEPGSAGIMLFGSKDKIDVGIPCALDGEWEIRWERTCFMQASAPVQPVLIPIGLQLLDTWQVAVPLVDYRVLAADEGSNEERAYTASVIRDLRVPLYDTRLVFVRRCEEGEALIEQYKAEGMTRLGFLRAVYRVKPLILALPVTWTGQWAPTTA